MFKSASIILKDKKTERKRIINAESCSVGKTTLLNATLEPVNYLAFTWQERGCGVEMVKKAVIEVTLVGESYTTANREIEDEIVLELSRNLYAVPWAERIERIRVRGK